jgi:hypothetical protein
VRADDPKQPGSLFEQSPPGSPTHLLLSLSLSQLDHASPTTALPFPISCLFFLISSRPFLTLHPLCNSSRPPNILCSPVVLPLSHEIRAAAAGVPYEYNIQPAVDLRLFSLNSPDLEPQGGLLSCTSFHNTTLQYALNLTPKYPPHRVIFTKSSSSSSYIDLIRTSVLPSRLLP